MDGRRVVDRHVLRAARRPRGAARRPAGRGDRRLRPLGGLALALLPVGIASVALGVAFGIAIGPPAGAIVALPTRVLSPEQRAGGFGVFYTGYYIIMAAGPALAGMPRERAGTAAAAVLFAAASMASIAPLLGLFWLLARPALTRGRSRRRRERRAAPHSLPAWQLRPAALPAGGPEPARGRATRSR